MKFGDTIYNSIACNNTEAFVVKDNKINDVSTLVCGKIVVEIRWQRPNHRLVRRWNKQMLEIWDIPKDSCCNINTISRNLVSQRVSKRTDETTSAAYSLIEWQIILWDSMMAVVCKNPVVAGDGQNFVEATIHLVKTHIELIAGILQFI